MGAEGTFPPFPQGVLKTLWKRWKEEINTPKNFIDGLGQFAVDETTESKTMTHYFHTKEEALALAARTDASFHLRDTTLEDVFVERAKKDEGR